MTKLDRAAQAALVLEGSPYIFGAYGQKCTPQYRRDVMKSKPAYAEKIRKNCPVLSGRQGTCEGCRYREKKAFDCRGLTWFVLNQVGIKISRIGATTQWKTDSWKEKGTIEKMPPGKACILFREGGGLMQHTGIKAADGTVADARGHAYGVMRSGLSSYGWTHYAIPYGADTQDEEETPMNEEKALFKATVMTKDDPLRIRRAPVTGEVIGHAPIGARVDVLTDGEWAKIRYQGLIGYASRAFLQPEFEDNDLPDRVEGVDVTTLIEESTGQVIQLVGRWREAKD